MNVSLLIYGSRGDLQPFLALACGLAERGHHATLVAPGRFQEFVEVYGVKFVPLTGDPVDLSRRLNDSGHNFIKMVGEFMDHAVDVGAQVLHRTEAACAESELIVHSFAHAAGAHTQARELNIPDVHVQIFPMFAATGDYPNVTLPDMKLRWLNRMTHTFSGKVFEFVTRQGFERVRRRAGLPPRAIVNPFRGGSTRPRTPILCAWSPAILPPSRNWETGVHVTGYFFLPQKVPYQPPPELDAFLAAGEPPVCVSFGSMLNRNSERIHAVVRAALNRYGSRGIILAGWAGVRDRPSREVHYPDAVPHEWLLPRCRMIVHHGGAGTTAAGLRAGTPSVVVPFTGDQPFWGRRVHAIGAGPEPILVGRLSPERLARALAAADDGAVRERARSLGEKIRAETGIRNAVGLIEAHAASWGAA